MYNVKLTRRDMTEKIINRDLTENNARVIAAELKRLDRRRKFMYSVERG